MTSVGAMAERGHIYTVKEIAEILRIAPKTVRSLIAREQIDAFIAGNEYRITQYALDEFIRKQSKKRENEAEQ